MDALFSGAMLVSGSVKEKFGKGVKLLSNVLGTWLCVESSLVSLGVNQKVVQDIQSRSFGVILLRHLHKLLFRYTPVNWRSFMNYMTLNDIKLCHMNMHEIMNAFPGQWCFGKPRKLRQLPFHKARPTSPWWYVPVDACVALPRRKFLPEIDDVF